MTVSRHSSLTLQNTQPPSVTKSYRKVSRGQKDLRLTNGDFRDFAYEPEPVIRSPDPLESLILRARWTRSSRRTSVTTTGLKRLVLPSKVDSLQKFQIEFLYEPRRLGWSTNEQFIRNGGNRLDSLLNRREVFFNSLLGPKRSVPSHRTSWSFLLIVDGTGDAKRTWVPLWLKCYGSFQSKKERCKIASSTKKK